MRHSDGSWPPPSAVLIATSADSLMRRRAALNMRNAIGSSTTTAAAMLVHMSLVRRSSMTSNHASQHSSVPVTSRQAITIWRPRQNAQPVAAKAASSTMSKPTQASRQWVAVYSRCKVKMSTTIQPASTIQEMTEKRTASLRRRARFTPSIGCG
jgi:hypothetical protein